MNERVDLYRAEATRCHNGRVTRWKGRWQEDSARAIKQARRWQGRDAIEAIEVVCSNGTRATPTELEQALLSGKPK